MSTGPNYDFIQFRNLVQDITQDFKRISEEIIKIECQLRHMQPELSMHVAKVQDYEKRQLELVSKIICISEYKFITAWNDLDGSHAIDQTRASRHASC